jgi:pheromone receptor transcription factor
MSDNDPQPSPGHDNSNSAGVAQGAVNGGMGNGQPGVGQDLRGVKRPRTTTGDDDDDDDDGKPNRERRKIEIKFIQDKSRRHITFSKRKAGIMKKAYELSVLTGTQVLLLVVSETGLVYTFTTPKLQPLVTKSEGKNLIQACLNAPEPGPHSSENGADVEPPESPEETHAQLPPQQGRAPPIQANYMTAEQHTAYQQYLAQVQQQQRGAYSMPHGQQPPHSSHAS